MAPSLIRGLMTDRSDAGGAYLHGGCMGWMVSSLSRTSMLEWVAIIYGGFKPSVPQQAHASQWSSGCEVFLAWPWFTLKI